MIQRILMILVILVTVLGGGYYAYRELVPPPPAETMGPVYATRPVTRGNLSVGVEAVGPLNPTRGGEIVVPGGPGPMGPGTAAVGNYSITEILVKEGDEVRQGQLLVKLNASDLQGQIATVEEQLQTEIKSLAGLLNVPPDQVEQVDPYRGITLTAPIDGRVTELGIKAGQELKQGQIVGKVVDDSRFRMIAKLLSAEIEKVEVNQQVLLSFPYFEGLTEARVIDVNPNPIAEPVSELLDSVSWGSEQGGKDDQKFNFWYVYWVTVEGSNPGLIRPEMVARVGFLPSGSEATETTETDQEKSARAFWARYLAKVERYVDEEQVLSTVEAIVTRVHVREMALVKAGDPLISLAGEDTRQMIQERLDRIREQRLKISQLQGRLSELEIRSPMDGVVANISAQPGQSVQPGQWLGSIFHTSEMMMWVELDDIDIVLVKQGSPVRVTVDALAGRNFEGEVIQVAMAGKGENGISRFQVGIRVTGGSDRGSDLRPGMQAKAMISAAEARDVLLVPLEAVFEEDGQPKVEVLQDDGVITLVPVELGLMNDRFAEVKSGLEEGSEVVTGSTADLLPSQRLRSTGGLLPDQTGGENGNTGNSGTSGVRGVTGTTGVGIDGEPAKGEGR